MLKEWGVEDPETAREGAATIHRESQHMNELVENLLSLSRGDEGPPLRPHLHDFAAEAVVASNVAAGGRLSVRHVPAPAPVRASVDREGSARPWPSCWTMPSSTPLSQARSR